MRRNQPTLRRRMIVNIALMLLGPLSISVGAMIAINGLRQDLSISVQGYRQLKQLFDVGFLTSKAREAMADNPPQPQRAISALQAASAQLNRRSNATDVDGPPNQWFDESGRKDCQSLISQAIRGLGHGSSSLPSLNLIFSKLSKISDDVRESVAHAQEAADNKRKLTMWFILGLCIAVVIGAIAIGIHHYRQVINPLRQLGDGARAFAKRKLESRISLTGDREFVLLANDFNQMANDLTALYQDLEQKVETKSRELVQSERLASVGYLAAGVAHEINNPLGIIAGYGERAIQHLSVGLDDSTLLRTQKALSVICGEAFRCKQITDRLLSLACPGSPSKTVVSIAKVAQEIISTLSELGTVGSRSLSSTIDPGLELSVLVDQGELKQVLLNLIINGLEAVDPGTGKVHVTAIRDGNDIQLRVIDNGVGMTPETIDLIFQPFYTEKRGKRPGTGLGLSIVHAIIKNQGGQITATSAGTDRGSTFIVQLPAAA